MPSQSEKKRPHTETDTISPPPLRRKLQVEDASPSTSKAQDKTHLNSRHEAGTFQIFSWNVNGISHLLPTHQKSIKSFFTPPSPQGDDKDARDFNTLRGFLKRHHWPQYLALQEVKIALKDLTTQRLVEKAANANANSSYDDNEGPRYTPYFSLPRDKHNATGWGGKVYGVCTLLRHDIASLPGQSTEEVPWDLEGRVLVTKLPSLRLVIINGYWVNGTMNPYRDPKTGHITGTRHDRKRAFHSLMLGEVQSYQAKQWDVVLVGDMNIARSSIDGYPGIRLGTEHVKNRADFNSKFFEDEGGMRGVDSWRWCEGERKGYTYHGEVADEWGRACDRVDLGVVTRGLVEGEKKALVGSEIWESVVERGRSDHVPISVVLDEGVVMRGDGEEVDG